MITKIEIDCDTESELYVHLSVIRSQLKKAFKENKNKMILGQREKAIINVYDCNCYGVHYAAAHINK